MRKVRQQVVWTLVCLLTMYRSWAAPPGTTEFIRIDQFGYLQNARKVAVIVSPQVGLNAGTPFDASTGPNQYQVRRWSDDTVVFTGTLVAWKDGVTQSQSGDKGWWFDFSTVNTPGSYYVFDMGRNVGSYRFEIGDKVYDEVLKAAVRTYFYQRINCTKQPPYTDAKWADAASHEGPGQDRQATSRYAKGNISTAKDVSGGWMDAGDMNKYVTFAEEPVALLLEAYRHNPAVFTDSFHIPESGNGVPDILDEVKWELDFMRRMQDATGTGGLLLKVGVDTYLNPSTPPSTDKRPRYYLPECTSSTLSGAAMFAVGGAVYRTIPSMSAYAQDLTARAEQAFARARVTTANFTTFQTDCDDMDIRSGDADKPADIQLQSAVVAAVYLFEVTGKAEYKAFVDAKYNQIQPMANEWWGPYLMHVHAALLRYAANPAATAAVASAIRTMKSQQNSVLSIADYTAKTDLYRAHMADAQYHWGSNQVRGNAGVANLDFVNFNVNPANKALYREIANEYLHWFHGVNAQGKVMLSNMYAYGADNSQNEIYHTWFADGSDWDNALTSPKGPAPGYLPGGPNNMVDYNGSTEGYLRNEPLQKRYKDYNGEFPQNSWFFTEVAIYNQAPYVSLLSRLIVPTSDPSDTEPPTTPGNLVASNLSPYSVKLTWTGSTDNRGVTAYEVYQNGTRIAETNELSVSVETLSPSTSYTFTVKAVDFSGNRSNPSNAALVNTPGISPNDFILYGDALKSTVNTGWSWNSTNDPDNTDPVKAGQKSLKVNVLASWGALSLRNSEVLNTTNYPGGVQFWFYGSGKTVRVVMNQTDTGTTSDSYRINAEPNTWTLIRIPWSDWGNPTTIQRLSFMDGSDGPQTFFLDDVRLVAGEGSVDTEAPTAPTNLTTSNIQTNSLRLNWNASTDNIGVVAYEVLQGSTVLNGNVSGTSLDLTGLACTTTYNFTVRAKDAAGNRSANSNTVYATTVYCSDADTQAPTVPTNLTATSVTATGLTLSWSASTDNVGVTTYAVYQNGVLLNGNVSGTSLDVAGLTCNKEYGFTVRAKDASGNVSENSGSLYLTTTTCADSEAPTIPANVVASNVTTSGLTLTWTASTDNVGVTGYEVYQNGTLLNSSEIGTSLTVSNLVCGTMYTFTVKAKDAAGNWSAGSIVVNVTTLACPPASPSGSEVVYDEALNANWQEWSWSVNSNYAATSPVKVGQKTLALNYTDGWGGWSIIRNNAFIPTPQTTVRFWLYATTNKPIGVVTYADNETGSSPYVVVQPTPNVWQEVVLTMPQLANPAKIKRLVMQSQGSGANLIYVDNVHFEGSFNVSVSNVTTTALRLNWSAPANNVAGYEVYQNGSLLNGSVLGTSLDVTGLSCGTAYSFSVRAKDASGNGLVTSVPVSATTTVCPGLSTVEMIYDDAFSPGWDDWSWGLTADYASTGQVKVGQKAAALTFDGWGAWSIFRKTYLPVTAQSTIRFWIYPTTDKKLTVTTYAENDSQASQPYSFQPKANVWQEVVITMAQLGNPTRIKRLIMNLPTSGSNPVSLDNVRIETPNGSARTANASAEYPAEGRMTISPNPADGPVRVRVLTDETQSGTSIPATLSVMSLSGTVVASHAVQAQPGLNEYTLDLNRQPSGTYLVQWQTATKRFVQRLVLVK